jgi:hypothetical protein
MGKPLVNALEPLGWWIMNKHFGAQMALRCPKLLSLCPFASLGCFVSLHTTIISRPEVISTSASN